MRGKLISIEGGDGCGKSTHARLLASWLRARGHQVVVTDEPTDSAIGRIIKRALRGELKLSISAEALLFAADRVQHVEEVIKPALSAGKVVIIERYLDSSLAYQSARGAPLRWLKIINKRAIKPNLTILIDLPAKTAITRIKREPDEFERDFHLQQQVRRNYLRLAKQKKIKVVNGIRETDEVQAEIRKLVKAKLL